MNPNVGAAMWIIAMLIGFVIWWPIGAMILSAITFTALMQQLTGHRPFPHQLPPQPQQPLRQPYQPLAPLYFDEKGNKLIGQDKPKQVTSVPVKLLTYKDKF